MRHSSTGYLYTLSFCSGLYYDSIQNDIGAERAFLEANRLNVATSSSMEMAGPSDIPAEVDSSVSETGPEEPGSEGALATGFSEDPKIPEVHGKKCFLVSIAEWLKMAYQVDSAVR